MISVYKIECDFIENEDFKDLEISIPLGLIKPEYIIKLDIIKEMASLNEIKNAKKCTIISYKWRKSIKSRRSRKPYHYLYRSRYALLYRAILNLDIRLIMLNRI